MTGQRKARAIMSKRVLVIDDEQAAREAFVYALDDEPYAIETAASGEEGLIKAQAQRPDLIFLDLRMPGIDGVETLRRLQVCCAEVPVYIVTGFRKEYVSALEQAARDGLTFEVTDKPLDDEQIRAITHTVFGPPKTFD